MSPTIMSGLKPSLEDRVRAAVDRHEHGLHVAHVGPQDAQVLLVVDAPHDDQHRPVAEVGRRTRAGRSGPRAGRARRGCGHRVLGERLERLADAVARCSWRVPDGLAAPAPHPRDTLAVAQHRARRGPRSPRRPRAGRRAARPAGRRGARPPRRGAAGPGSGTGRTTSAPRSARSGRPRRRGPRPETRSMSSWSITAMSPGRRRFTSRLVRFPSRARPGNAVELGCRWPRARARLARPVEPRHRHGSWAVGPASSCTVGPTSPRRCGQQLLGVPAGAVVARVGAEHAAQLVEHERRPRAVDVGGRARRPPSRSGSGDRPATRSAADG